MDRPICSASEGIFNYAFRALRTHGANDYLAPYFFFDPQRLFQRVSIRLVNFKREIRFFDPGRILIDAQDRVLVRDLFHQNDDLHGFMELCTLAASSGPSFDYASPASIAN